MLGHLASLWLIFWGLFWINTLTQTVSKATVTIVHFICCAEGSNLSESLPAFVIVCLFSPKFLFYLFWERESERGRERERENPKQAPRCQCGAGHRGWSQEPWDHDLSQYQELDAQLIEPSKCLISFIFFDDSQTCRGELVLQDGFDLHFLHG